MTQRFISNYYDLDRIRRGIDQGNHRSLVGGLWEEIGELTFRFLIDHGLRPDQLVLDVGCGCLRIGVHLVQYLDEGHYFGTDISADLLAVGYDVELFQRNLQAKVPREHLQCDGSFDFSRLPATRPFDIILAQSVFTHLPGNHIRLCLHNLAEVTRPGAVFYATVFLCPEDGTWAKPIVHEPGGKTSYPAQDPYHYTSDDLRTLARALPWRLESIEDWSHPRDQMMARFVRTAE